MKNKTKAMSFQKDKIKIVKKKISPSQKSLLSKKSRETSKNKPVLKGSAALRKRVEEAAKKASVEWQATFDAVSDAICLLDVDNHIIRCNRTMNEIFGITQEELRGSHCWEIVHGTTEPIPDCPVSKVKSSLQLEEMETQIKGKWLNIIAYPVLDDSHVLIAIVHIIRDITDRKKAEEKLRENERQYRLLTEKMSDVVWIADMNLRTTYVSPSVKNILGFSQEERMRQPLDEQLTPHSLSLVMEALSRELTLEEQGNADPNRTLKIELEYYHKDGTTRWMELVISGLRNDQGVLTGIHGLARDITERKKAEDELKESENKYRLLAENIQDVVFVMDMNLNYTYISPSVKILRGYEPEEALKHTPAETLTPSSVDLVLRSLSEIMEIEKSEHRDINISRTLQLEMTRKDGTTFWVEMKASFIRDENQRPVGIMGLTRDITERKNVESQRETALEALRESEYKYKSLIENIHDIIFTIDLEGKITFVSKRAKEISGYENAEMINKNIFNFIPEEDHQRTMENLQKGIKGEKIKHIQMPVTAKSGEKLFFEFSFSRIYKDGAVVGAQGTAVDITERKKAEDELRKSELRYRELSIIDDLTQLYNSRHFYALLEREVERSNRYEQPLTILMLDIDKFKAFNDTYGHIEGDYVLSRLGQMVKRCLRETDSAYRYGGEEFMIMLPMTTSDEGVVTAKRIQAALRKEAFPLVLGQEVYITVSIGLAQYKPKEEMKAFVHRVDQFMYQAKKNGRNRIFFESQLQEQFNW